MILGISSRNTGGVGAEPDSRNHYSEFVFRRTGMLRLAGRLPNDFAESAAEMRWGKNQSTIGSPVRKANWSGTEASEFDGLFSKLAAFRSLFPKLRPEP